MRAGQVVIFPFPYSDLTRAKLRPALLLRETPGGYGDWLVCMISSQINQAVSGFDEIIAPNDPDFAQSGLKCPSVIRLGRLAVVDPSIFLGALGEIGVERQERLLNRLVEWIRGGLIVG